MPAYYYDSLRVLSFASIHKPATCKRCIIRLLNFYFLTDYSDRGVDKLLNDIGFFVT